MEISYVGSKHFWQYVFWTLIVISKHMLTEFLSPLDCRHEERQDNTETGQTLV